MRLGENSGLEVGHLRTEKDVGGVGGGICSLKEEGWGVHPCSIKEKGGIMLIFNSERPFEVHV